MASKIIHQFTSDLKIIFVPGNYGTEILYRPQIKKGTQIHSIPLLFDPEDIEIALIKLQEVMPVDEFNFFCLTVSGCLSYVLKRRSCMKVAN